MGYLKCHALLLGQRVSLEGHIQFLSSWEIQTLHSTANRRYGQTPYLECVYRDAKEWNEEIGHGKTHENMDWQCERKETYETKRLILVVEMMKLCKPYLSFCCWEEMFVGSWFHCFSLIRGDGTASNDSRSPYYVDLTTESLFDILGKTPPYLSLVAIEKSPGGTRRCIAGTLSPESQVLMSDPMLRIATIASLYSVQEGNDQTEVGRKDSQLGNEGRQTRSLSSWSNLNIQKVTQSFILVHTKTCEHF